MNKAIIVGVNYYNDDIFLYEIEELKSLAKVIDIDVTYVFTQKLEYVNPSFYVGSGKIDEINFYLSENEINIIIFNDELTPSQISTLEKTFEKTIYDRTYVILEIFKKRAKTKEAILQVELANLTYILPRLQGMRKGLSRQTASSSAKSKGKGETKLELDRRYYASKIVMIKKELEEMKYLRRNQRKKRIKQNIPTISLVGYTNSGKSTLLNKMMDYSLNLKKEVFEKDMLFATLETSTRNIVLSDFNFLLTDTVGFVQKLPTSLIEAFKSTLEEIKESSLILHIVDSSNPNFEKQIETTNLILKELGVDNINMIYCFNKIDTLNDYLYIKAKYPKAIRISAKNDINIDKLIEMIKEELIKPLTSIKVLIPFTKLSLVNDIKKRFIIKEIEKKENGIYVDFYIDNSYLHLFQNYIINSL